MDVLGERTVGFDCDVLQADGGTRTAAISGVWVALALAAARHGLPPPADHVAAVSVGLVEGTPLLDLDYEEDAAADVDMNVVMTGDGRMIEVQATAEGAPFGRARLDELLELAAKGIAEIVERQREAVAGRRSRVALASRNPGKLRELRALLPGWEIEPADTSGIEETGATFYENARSKASPCPPGGAESGLGAR